MSRLCCCMEQAEACIDKQDHANKAQTFANESMTALESCENTVTVDWQGSQQYLRDIAYSSSYSDFYVGSMYDEILLM